MVGMGARGSIPEKSAPWVNEGFSRRCMMCINSTELPWGAPDAMRGLQAMAKDSVGHNLKSFGVKSEIGQKPKSMVDILGGPKTTSREGRAHSLPIFQPF